MNLIRKYKKEIILLMFTFISYFVLRLIFIANLPIFTDEAIYLRWAQIALHDASWRFISLTDGKQPLYVWVTMIFLKLISDPLLAGRLVSVFTGFFTLVGLILLSYELFKNKTISFFTGIIYVSFPFAQVLDRMALYDSMVATFYVWALYFSVVLVRKVRLDVAYTLGFVIAGGILTKSSSFFSIYLMPFLFILFDFKQKFLTKKLLSLTVFLIFSALISYSLYNILRLSPLYEMIAIKNATFVYPLSEWIKHPFVYFVSNISGLTSWLFQYLTFSYLILIVLSLVLFTKSLKEKGILFIYFFLPFIALALFGKLIYPRHFFFMSVMLLPLIGWSLNFLFDRSKQIIPKNLYFLAKALLVAIVLFYPLYISVMFAVNPLKAPIADADSNQYLNNWSAGWGVSESVSFFKEKAKSGKIFIATEGTFGLMPETMEMYLVENPNVTIKGYWPIGDRLPKETLDYAKKMPVYFIFYQPEHRELKGDFPLKLIFEVKQGNSNYYYRVYQVIPQK